MAITITAEDIQNAKSYMSLYHKLSITQMMAKLCVRVLSFTGEDNGGLPIPDRCVEDRAMRQQCLMGVLAAWYFGKKYNTAEIIVEKDDGTQEKQTIAMCMDADDLDEWSGSHVLNQLERWKKEKATANKVYDLLGDFKMFEIFLNGAIRDELEARNDPALRMAQMIALQGSPENMKEVIGMLRDYEANAKEG